MTGEQRTQLLLRLLSKEEAAALAGRGSGDPQAEEPAKLHGQLAERDQVIGGMTIANRI